MYAVHYRVGYRLKNQHGGFLVFFLTICSRETTTDVFFATTEPGVVSIGATYYHF